MILQAVQFIFDPLYAWLGFLRVYNFFPRQTFKLDMNKLSVKNIRHMGFMLGISRVH